MQAGRRGASSTSQGRESTSFNHEFQSDPGFSWTSTYAARSPPKVSKNGKSSRSFWEVVDTITGGCTSCFAPRQSKIKERHVKPSNDGHDISISSSKLTFLSWFINQTSISAVTKSLIILWSLHTNNIRYIYISKLDVVGFLGFAVHEKCNTAELQHNIRTESIWIKIVIWVIKAVWHDSFSLTRPTWACRYSHQEFREAPTLLFLIDLEYRYNSAKYLVHVWFFYWRQMSFKNQQAYITTQLSIVLYLTINCSIVQAKRLRVIYCK